MMNFEFGNPWAFWFLLLLPILFYRWNKNEKPNKILDPRFLSLEYKKNRVLEKILKLRGVWIAFLRSIVFVLLILALARPRSVEELQQNPKSGIDILMVMDVSLSMNVEDFGKKSRIALAQETMLSFVHGRKSDRIGFGVFSGEPMTLVPPTLDYELVLEAIQNAKTGVLKDGTAIGDGLALALNRLKDSQSPSKVVILLTDGESNIGQIDPMTAGELAKELGIKVYTIAIGKEGRVRVPVPQKTPLGGTVMTYQYFENALNTDLLKKIAKITSGEFFRVTNADTLRKVFQKIDALEKTEIQKFERTLYQEHFDRFLLAALILSFFELVLGLFIFKVGV